MKREACSIALLLTVLLAGCGGKPPVIHYYLLEPAPRDEGERPATVERGWDVGVKTFHVDPPYDQDRIVYRVRDRSSEVGFYAYHRWAAPLSRMLPLAVATGLEGADGVRVIEPAVTGRRYDALLTGRVQTIEEVDHAGGQDIVVRMKLGLRSSDGTELWSEVLTARETINTTEVGEIVERMGRVVDQIIEGARVSFGLAVTDASSDEKRGAPPA